MTWGHMVSLFGTAPMIIDGVLRSVVLESPLGRLEETPLKEAIQERRQTDTRRADEEIKWKLGKDTSRPRLVLPWNYYTRV